MGSYTIFLALIVIVAFLLIVVIMVQNPKGGGLSSSFGGSGTQQLGGVKQTTDFLDKSTWYLGAALVGLILLSNITFTQSVSVSVSKALNPEENIDEPPTTTQSEGFTTEDFTTEDFTTEDFE